VWRCQLLKLLNKKELFLFKGLRMVRSRRLELPRAFAHNDLNVARLPIPPRPHMGIVERDVAKRTALVKPCICK
jgi:hypothetical protein